MVGRHAHDDSLGTRVQRGGSPGLGGSASGRDSWLREWRGLTVRPSVPVSKTGVGANTSTVGSNPTLSATGAAALAWS